MAAKRIATSAVNWGAFAELVPANQTEIFRAFKAKSEGFVSKVHAYPEALPKIDWAFYKSRIALPGLVDKFEKGYSAVNVPYPKDVSNLKSAVDAEEKEAIAETKQFVADLRSQIESAKLFVSKMESVPPMAEMTHEMYADYFPEQARDPWNRPTIWPHTHNEQLGNDPHEIK